MKKYPDLRLIEYTVGFENVSYTDTIAKELSLHQNFDYLFIIFNGISIDDNTIGLFTFLNACQNLDVHFGTIMFSVNILVNNYDVMNPHWNLITEEHKNTFTNMLVNVETIKLKELLLGNL